MMQYKLGRIRQNVVLFSKPLFVKNYKIDDRPGRQTGLTLEVYLKFKFRNYLTHKICLVLRKNKPISGFSKILKLTNQLVIFYPAYS